MNEKNKILYIVSHPIYYQAPLLRLISESKDIAITALFYWNKKSEVHFDEGFGRPVAWDVPVLSGYPYQFLSELAHSKNKFQKLCALWGAINSKKYDIVWTHGYADLYTMAAIVFAKLKGLKVFVRGESLFFGKEKNTLKRKFFFAVLDKCVDRYLAIGTQNKNFYLKNNIAPHKIFLCHYAVDNHFFREKYLMALEKIAELKKSLQLEENRPIILYASKFIKRKHPIDLLNAFKKLDQNKKSYLLFIGTGETYDEVMQQASMINDNSVRFLGFKNQTQLPSYFALADIFVLPSQRENWGLVVNEAMNAECAIVVSDEVGCGVDLVRQAENGFIFPARNCDALAQCLQKLMDDPALRETMKKNSGLMIAHWGYFECMAGLKSACESLRK